MLKRIVLSIVAVFAMASVVRSAQLVNVAVMPDSLNIIGNTGNSVTSGWFKLVPDPIFSTSWFGGAPALPDSGFVTFVYGLNTVGAGADTTDINLWLDVGTEYNGTIYSRDSCIIAGVLTDKVWSTTTVTAEYALGVANIGFGSHNVSVLGNTGGFAPWVRLRAKAGSAGNDSTVIKEFKIYLVDTAKASR